MSKSNEKLEILGKDYSEQELVLLKECIELFLCEICENKITSKSYDLNDIMPLMRLNKEISESLLDGHNPKYDIKKEVSHE